ncbi:hypothetical protein, partial [Longispora fulva]|uniref:hypothetical protein n=1 Tax=Longispora fulva TaxID=619741 RepID=UPI001941CDEC
RLDFGRSVAGRRGDVHHRDLLKRSLIRPARFRGGPGLSGMLPDGGRFSRQGMGSQSLMSFVVVS